MFGLGTGLRIASRNYEEYKEWRRELIQGKPEDGIIEEVGGSSSSGVCDCSSSSETKTNVNVRAGVSPQVRARNNWYEVSSFQCEQDFCRSEIAEELKQFSCKEKQKPRGCHGDCGQNIQVLLLFWSTERKQTL